MDDRHKLNESHGPHHRDDSTNEQRRHAEFVAALDRLPENCWESNTMINDLESMLQWGRDEIEVYAYRYMAALMQVEEEDKQHKNSTKNSVQPAKIAATGWSPEEVRLLQTLLASFSDVPGGSARQHVSVRLARFFPQKNGSEMEQQIELLRRSSPS